MNLKRLSVFCMLLCFLLFLFSACQSDGVPVSEVPIVTNTPVPIQKPTPTTALFRAVVPAGEPEAIDGVLSPGEWNQAFSDTFADGSEILLMHQDGYLYVAIRANTTGAVAGNIYLFTGDEISIHHTSAALGTGRYQQDGESWQLAQTFDWRCRETNDSETARYARENFFQDEGWVSINSWMGTPNELEYKIEMPEGSFRLAANYLTATTDAVKIPWPRDLADDSIVIMTGGLPQQLAFAPEDWASVEILD